MSPCGFHQWLTSNNKMKPQITWVFSVLCGVCLKTVIKAIAMTTAQQWKCTSCHRCRHLNMVKMVTFMLCILYHKESQRTGGNNYTKPWVKTEWGLGEPDDDLYCSDRANGFFSPLPTGLSARLLCLLLSSTEGRGEKELLPNKM